MSIMRLCVVCGGSFTILPYRAADTARGKYCSTACSGVGRRKYMVAGIPRLREYTVWMSMLDRCLNERSSAWKGYGGRGITVDASWRESFAAFFADMGECPDGRTLDRKDNDKGYGPDNCRWATDVEQCNNKRSNVRVTIHGRTQTLAEWARETGVGNYTLAARLKRGWPEDRLLSVPDPKFWRGRRAK